jgi:serine/threonine protein kinase
MPPEGVDGAEALTARSDLYSLGCAAFFLLTGELPFRASTLMQMLAKHLNEPPKPPSVLRGESIPEALDSLVVRCLAKDPLQRPANGAALLAEVEPIAAAHPWTQEEAIRWWAAVAAPAKAPA